MTRWMENCYIYVQVVHTKKNLLIKSICLNDVHWIDYFCYNKLTQKYIGLIQKYRRKLIWKDNSEKNV